MGSGERRRALLVLAGGAGLSAAALAWPWLLAQVIAPLALVFWLLLRLFVLSVHQVAWWMALLLAGAAALGSFLLRRAALAEPSPVTAPASQEHPVEGWRRLIQQAAAGLPVTPAFGWNGFLRLAVSLGALEQRVMPDFLLVEALRAGQVPLPAEIHAFLFPPSAPAGSRFARQLRRLRDAPGRILGRLTGRDRLERLAAVERLLAFLEASLEMPRHDHDPD